MALHDERPSCAMSVTAINKTDPAIVFSHASRLESQQHTDLRRAGQATRIIDFVDCTSPVLWWCIAIVAIIFHTIQMVKMVPSRLWDNVGYSVLMSSTALIMTLEQGHARCATCKKVKTAEFLISGLILVFLLLSWILWSLRDLSLLCSTISSYLFTLIEVGLFIHLAYRSRRKPIENLDEPQHCVDMQPNLPYKLLPATPQPMTPSPASFQPTRPQPAYHANRYATDSSTPQSWSGRPFHDPAFTNPFRAMPARKPVRRRHTSSTLDPPAVRDPAPTHSLSYDSTPPQE